ncbi:MAG: cupin domain-containing protein [Thermoplasmatota archaeon]
MPSAASLPLESLPWEDLDRGVAQKKARDGTTTVRLVRFPASFAGETPCERGHVGFLMAGAAAWDIGGKTVKLAKGEAIVIPDGVPHRLFVGATDATFLFVENHK